MRLITLFILSALSLACAQGSLPLVQAKDMVYMGSFSLPNDTKGTSRAGYGGQGITPYTDPVTGKKTIFIGGHMQKPGQVAQFEIPSTLVKGGDYTKLPQAAWVQPFANVLDGDLRAKAGITTADGGSVWGLQVYGGRLLVTATEYYGSTQQYTHGYASLDLSNGTDFKGFFKLNASAPIRAQSGPMAIIPSEWRASFGGPVMSGIFGVAIVSSLSTGPTATVFNPDSLGPTPSRGYTVLHYPLEHPLCAAAVCAQAAEDATSAIFNAATRFGGMGFPKGTRSVLFIGRHGTGPYCYGLPDCQGGGIFDSTESDGKGPHAWPYRYQVWAYDANDLVKVKQGAMLPYDVRPYSVFGLPDLDALGGYGGAKIQGAGLDPADNRFYIATNYAERPRVDVYQVSTPGDTTLPPVLPVDTAKTCKADTVRPAPVIIRKDSLIYVDKPVPGPVRDSLIYVDRPVPGPVRIVVESVTVQDTSFLGEKYSVPGLGSIQKIKTSRGVYLVVDMAGMPVSINKVAK